jgi:predicted ATPase/DNA-binding SARP family transcriptional activator/uncharacterized protein HemY
MSHLAIDVLGPLRVSIDGHPITALESVKVRALLAYLAVESGHAHSRAALVGLLWPDFTESSARHNLRQALFNLREILSDATAPRPFLRITRDEIQFNRESDYALDIDSFNHYSLTRGGDSLKSNEDPSMHALNLEEMVKLYRGEFLQQLMVDDSAEFEDWLLVQRESLHQRVLDAHNYLANYYEQRADLINTRRHATRQLELDPWREEAHRQLMRVLAMDGQRTAALAQYETCKRVLAEELDVEPSVETRELYEQIKHGNLSKGSSGHPNQPDQTVNLLPVQLTPFVGRAVELKELGEYLQNPECRCLTLLGPGGIGKTRLAVQAASNYVSCFAQGAAFVPLAPVGSMVSVVPAIMNALDISFFDQSDPKVYLFSHFQDKQMLLVLDNVEQLLANANQQDNFSDLVIEIMQSAPGLKLLITTREALNIQEEYIFDVQGLAYPETDELEKSDDFDAITLFVQRARRVSSTFTLTAENRSAIARICRLVGGMPLAIELAATWMRILSPDEIVEEIGDSLDFLSTSGRSLPERHRSMRVVFDHSWQMLSEEEQLVLGKLSVFRGGFQRQAAEQVAEATLSILSTLVNRTLIRRAAPGRYDLHELVRQYCATRLEADQNLKKATKERHYAYYLALVKTSEQELHGANQLECLERLELEHDNLRIAFEWALESGQSSQVEDEGALQLASSLRWFWRMHGHFREGCDWLSEALKQAPARKTQARAAALLGLSLLTNGLGDLRASLAPGEESIKIYEELQDQPGLAEAVLVTGLTYLWQGEAKKGYERLNQALAIYRQTNDRWGEAHALYRLGSYMSDYGGDPAGHAMLEESEAVLEELGDKYLKTSVLVALGINNLSRGEYDSAQALLERSLSLTREIKHPWGIADALTNLGCLCRIRGDFLSAQSYFEEALEVYQKPTSSIWQTDVYCALAENAVLQGDFSNARNYLEIATRILGSSENKWLQVVIWYFRGLLAYYEGRYAEAAQLLEEDISFAREGQYKPDLARALITLGRVQLKLGEMKQAYSLIHESLLLFREIGQKLGAVTALEALGELRTAQGEFTKAVRLCAVAEGMRKKLGAPRPPIETVTYESTIASCREKLGEGSFVDIWTISTADQFDEIAKEDLKINPQE